MDADQYFEESQPPPHLDQSIAQVKEFIEHNNSLNRRIVLVTSGGTTVPLESQTVRFLDNFSAGTRGSASAEYFIEKGYACIFLHRQWSLEPYTRHYSHQVHCFLDLLNNENDKIVVGPKYQSEIRHVLNLYQKASQDKLLFKVNFTTVSDYLFLLKGITKEMNVLKSKAMFYLAAAVSDFYIPRSRMVEHKIQSSGGGLSLILDQVPKIISPLVKEWAPNALTISFKLETDPDLLLSKSRSALDRYQHQIVIGNILETRKHVVWLITRQGQTEIRLPSDSSPNTEIETRIVDELVKYHNQFISS